MILFLDEERAYLNWVTHHRTGFVLDCLRHPSKAHLVLHRASCPTIKCAPTKKSHWTTGKHQKVCGLDGEQLKNWALEQTGNSPADCEQCLGAAAAESGPHLTPLDRDILEIVLEIASIHIDEDDGTYSLTVAKIARCLGKTEGQLLASLARLVEEEMLILLGGAKPGEAPSPRSGLLPTAKALRTIPDFAALTDRQIEAELKKLA